MVEGILGIARMGDTPDQRVFHHRQHRLSILIHPCPRITALVMETGKSKIELRQKSVRKIDTTFTDNVGLNPPQNPNPMKGFRNKPRQAKKNLWGAPGRAGP